MITKYTRGMVYWINLPNIFGENVQSGRRPCIIISNDIGNMFSENITVVPCTTNLTRAFSQPTHLKTSVLKDVDSTVLCETVITISKKLTDGFIGVLDNKTMSEIDDCVKIALGLTDKPIPMPEPKPKTIIKTTDKPIRITTKEQKELYLKEYDEKGSKFVVEKYNIASENAAYQRYTYYKREI